jgi:hypothetical protein
MIYLTPHLAILASLPLLLLQSKLLFCCTIQHAILHAQKIFLNFRVQHFQLGLKNQQGGYTVSHPAKEIISPSFPLQVAT